MSIRGLTRAIAALAIPVSAWAQAGAVAGRVIDSATSAPRSGVSVSTANGRASSVTDSLGRFMLTRVPAGTIVLRVRAIGLVEASVTAAVRAGETTFVAIAVRTTTQQLDAMRIDAAAAERAAFVASPNVGAVELSARAMQAVPRLGEADPIRVVTMTPGVQSRNDFSTGFNVRGGESDQNLILLDDYPIYNPVHLGGLFSTFIGSTVRDVRLHNGAFPAQYGGRLSSVLDVQSNEDQRPGMHTAAEVSALASTGAVSGAFAGGKGSWLLSGRRTYADQVMQLVSDTKLPYHFRDEQAHLTYRLPWSTRIAATVYDGRDVLDGSFAEVADSTPQSAGGGDFFFSWGNLVGGATLEKSIGRGRLGDSATIEQRVSTSRFSTLLNAGAGSRTSANRVADFRIGGALSAFGRSHDRSIGYEVVRYDIDYSRGSPDGVLDYFATSQRPTVIAGYIDDLWRASSSLRIAAGVRAERMASSDFAAVSPRLSVKYLLSPTSAITAAAGHFTQWMHSLGYEDDPIRLFDYWRASDSASPVSGAWQFVLGHERWLTPTRYMRAELYFKRYDHLLEPNYADDPHVEGDEFLISRGTSYGGDLLVRAFETGPFSGWLSYTYAMSTRQHDSVRYTPSQDRRHDVNLIGSWRVAKFVIGARAGYASGMPYTAPTGSLPRRYFDPVRGQWGTGARATFEDLGGTRNGARYPATRRLDVHVERPFTRGRASISPYVSIVNVTDEKNVLFYLYDFTTAPASRWTITQFPFLPSGGFSIVF